MAPFTVSPGKWESLSYNASRSIRRGAENGNGGGSDLADRNYFSAPRIPSFFRENHFPFFASGPRNAPRKGSLPQRASPSFPFLASVIPGTCAWALSGTPTCLLWRIQSQWRRGWRFRYEFPAFRRAAAPSPISNIPSSRNEEFRPQNSPPHTRRFPYLLDFPTRGRKWGSPMVFHMVIDMRDPRLIPLSDRPLAISLFFVRLSPAKGTVPHPEIFLRGIERNEFLNH